MQPTVFSQYILRTPAFPIQNYLNLLENYAEESLLVQYERPYVQEAISIASPELKKALDQWLANPLALNPEKRQGLALSFLKYMARMSARCTPFGLFAGCSVGTWAQETNIVLGQAEQHTRFTQFDMHFWVAMLQELAQRKDVINAFVYYPNSSIYSLGDFYRYVEYKYVKTKREHSISALRKTEVLDLVWQEAQKGITVHQIVNLLIDDETDREEALEFVYQLVDFQFLVSELDATVTGSDEWTRVLTILDQIPALAKETQLLRKMKAECSLLDQEIVPEAENYVRLQSLIEQSKVPFEPKFLFQTDLNCTTNTNTLDQNIPKKVLKALRFLNGIQKKSSFANQANFAKSFTQRYESREMPLVTVLDTETGIGYLQNANMNDTHDLLEAFSFHSNSATDELIQQSWSSTDFILQKKLQAYSQKRETVISLTEQDFPDFKSSWEDAPATFSVMVEVGQKEDSEWIAIESSGGISAAKLLGRFCNGHEEIHAVTKEIVSKEQNFHHDKILAEIVHIPESRTGNILRRPVLREYEIAYLSGSGVGRDHTIDLNDLMVSVQGSKIVLRSKKHNKAVIPCLSNAHNYGSRALPIYQFLCDLQAQGVKPIYNFSWGVLESHYNYFPRVMYKEVILAKAKWFVDQTETAKFAKLEGTALIAAFSLWRQERGMPQYVNWVQSDNTLLLDFEKAICITMFLKSVVKLSTVVLEEFLFDSNSVVVDDKKEQYANQVIVSYFRSL